jgi:hypothetical protein
VGPRTCVDDVERRKILPLSGLELQHFGRPANSKSLLLLLLLLLLLVVVVVVVVVVSLSAVFLQSIRIPKIADQFNRFSLNF